MGVRSDIGVQNVQKILFGSNKGRSLIRGSFVAGATVHSLLGGFITKHDIDTETINS